MINKKKRAKSVSTNDFLFYFADKHKHPDLLLQIYLNFFFIIPHEVLYT